MKKNFVFLFFFLEKGRKRRRNKKRKTSCVIYWLSLPPGIFKENKK
jgi:hypothetical protein